MAQSLTVIPSARRLMDSLRDIGYELPAAVADLVDNSIDADATQVDIIVAFEGENSWIRIADDGTGMPASQMNEALRYGTDRDYDETDLGKFGLGLKTASLSQCRRLTVATRTNPDRREIEIRRWDLDHVHEADGWELLRLRPSEVREEIVEPLQDGPGTVVMWEVLDRVLDYRLPSGAAAENGLAAICRDIEAHLSMVFHRFLAQQARRALPLTITMQGNPIDAWDPFAREEEHTVKLDRQTISFRHAGRTHNLRLQPYIMPNQVQFSTTRAWEAASGPKKWNRQQGFYIYRGGRMIQSGGWNRLRTLDEHTKLARVAIDIPRPADTAFGINVSKMRVLIPNELRADLRAFASAVANRAQTAYRQTGESHSDQGSFGGDSTGAAADSGGGSPVNVHGNGSAAGDPTGGSTADGSGSNGFSENGSLSWDALKDVLRAELSDQPEMLERLLTALRRVVDKRPEPRERSSR
ncbi:MAG TPA: ATP-binding protein [Solirubrobacterales bacterium]